MRQLCHDATPWWLAPNLFALDAPLVAAVWQRFLGAWFGVAVPAAATVAFASAVWCVYLLDRWLDARRGSLDADRHHVAARYPIAFFIGCLFAGILTVCLATALPAGYVKNGIAVGLMAAIYLALVHSLASYFRSMNGFKELLVGLSFAAGVAIPLSASLPEVTLWLPSVSAFGGLCWLNCRLIDRWESTAINRPAWPEAVLGGVLLAGCFGLPTAIGAAIALACLGLATVHLTCRRNLRAARALADVVLLTPLLCWWLP